MTITEDIGTIVTAMKNDGIDVHYLAGHRLEISSRLDKMVKNPEKKYEKYPLIAFNEQYKTIPVRRGTVIDWTLNIAILAKTKKEYYSEDRETNVFKPTLDPLYDSFIEYLVKSGLFFWTGRQAAPPHRPVKRKYFGITSPEGNVRYIFNDPLDAIELVDLKVSQIINKCK
jgi:hypothetical protein